MTLRLYPDTILTEPCHKIDLITGELAGIAKNMFDIMYENDGMGLAAPQVGLGMAMFVWDAGEGPEVILNPSLSNPEGSWTHREGCLSIPGREWEITRPKYVLLSGYDLLGDPVQYEGIDMGAKLFHHEIDHLFGTLILDRLTKKQEGVG
jgi:peptide deformylase